MRVVTAEEMKMIEKKANEAGVSYTQMMENAGFAAYKEIIKMYGTKKTVVVAGRGNNGGDGYVVARYLALDGCDVTIVMAGGIPVTEDALLNYKRCEEMSLSIYDASEKEAISAINSAELIVEAVYGSGFHGELREDTKPLFKIINKSGCPICALDLAGGVNADNGAVATDAIIADMTVVFDSHKIAHTIPNAKKYFGKIILVDIGIPHFD